MKLDSQLTDDAVLAELGQRLARVRLARNITQRRLGTEARVGMATIQRLESGESVRLASLIRVLRALGLLGALDSLIPAQAPSPIELLELHGSARRRAERAPDSGPDPGKTRPWRWGDDDKGSTA